MLQPRISRPLSHLDTSLTTLTTSLRALTLLSNPPTQSLSPPPTFLHIHRRPASHAAQGRANGPKDSAGRRLGAKKSASQYVIPGNIIFKQRGTKWHPGENVGIGKDHTIYATVAGYVRYYRNPALHPKRRYIGVSLEREGRGSVLPTPGNAVSRRRVGMYAVPIKEGGEEREWLEGHLAAESVGGGEEGRQAVVVAAAGGGGGGGGVPARPVVMRQGLMHREANFEIGRAAERKGVKVREYDRGDRWLAWRKRAQKVKKAALARAAKANRKNKGKKANKVVAGGPGRRK